MKNCSSSLFDYCWKKGWGQGRRGGAKLRGGSMGKWAQMRSGGVRTVGKRGLVRLEKAGSDKKGMRQRCQVRGAEPGGRACSEQKGAVAVAYMWQWKGMWTEGRGHSQLGEAWSNEVGRDM